MEPGGLTNSVDFGVELQLVVIPLIHVDVVVVVVGRLGLIQRILQLMIFAFQFIALFLAVDTGELVLFQLQFGLLEICTVPFGILLVSRLYPSSLGHSLSEFPVHAQHC